LLVMSTAERQPGGRPPAPGELALVQSFLNSRWDLERDHEEHLGTPAELARWLAERGLLEPGTPLRQADLRRALEVREGLRELLFANNGVSPDDAAVERLNRALTGAALIVRMAPDRPPALASPSGGLDAALASIARIVAEAQIEGTWSRLKACPGRDCGWAFYDHSRNRSASWCSMSICGARTKAREYRRRKRGSSALSG
jgi:predicted RNA-binding Zn ribbon-like protein